MFKPITLRVYLLRAREAGICPEDILDGSGTAWSDIEALKPLDMDIIAGLFDYLARRTPPDFAIKCGYACKIRDFGIVGFTMMSMPTLREAFQYLNRYCRLVGHPLLNLMSERGDQWFMEFVPARILSSEAMRFCQEVSMAALEPVIEELTETPAETLGVDFSFDRPPSVDHYALFRTTNIRFGRPAGAYSGRRSDLNRPIRSRDGDVRDIFHRQCDTYLAKLTNARSTRDRLEDLMLASAGTIPSLDEMANALHISRRSLQRELSQEQLTYQHLIKDFRKRWVMQLLSENQSNIKMVAYLLGFRDVGSFRRAFREWTGQSISQWQARYGPAGPTLRADDSGARK